MTQSNNLESKIDDTDRDSVRRSTSGRLIARLAAVLLACGLFSALGASPASADTYVAGHRFATSSAACAPGRLSVYVGGNASDYSPNRYVQIMLWDYARGEWVYGGWHTFSSYGFALSNEFVFGHHGQYYPELHYAVLTSAGWSHGYETFPRFNQTNSIGQNYSSTTCSI
jgi:hypothetical protein